MVDLTVTGTSESGEHLLVGGPDGAEYRLRIDEDLRTALRRASATTRRTAEPRHLSPRDIQTLLRAGHDVDEIAEEHGLPRERVAPFEPPVMAERAFVTEQARKQRVGHDSDSPTLGDLVVDRLAARGVEVEHLAWDARRRAGESWQVGVTFVAARKERTAMWTIDLHARTLVAVDDEARWLSETDVSAGRRPARSDGPLGEVRSRPGAEPPWAREDRRAGAADRAVTDRDGSGADTTTAGGAPRSAGGGATEDPVTSPADLPDDDATEALLDDLAAHRGTRQDIDDLQDELDLDSLDEDDDGDDIPAAHPPASRPDQARDAQVLSLDAHRRARPGVGPDPDEVALDPRGTHPSGRGRPAPSTDEDARATTTARTADTRAEGGPAAGEATDAPDTHASDPDAEPPTDHGDGDPEDASPAAASPDADGSATEEDAPAPARTARSSRASGRKQRRSVPSWDEIVFGSRSDPTD